MSGSGPTFWQESGQDLPLNKLYFGFWAVCSQLLGNIFIVIDWWNLPRFTCLLGSLRQTVPLHESGLSRVQWPESASTQNKCRLTWLQKEKEKDLGVLLLGKSLISSSKEAPPSTSGRTDVEPSFNQKMQRINLFSSCLAGGKTTNQLMWKIPQLSSHFSTNSVKGNERTNVGAAAKVWTWFWFLWLLVSI